MSDITQHQSLKQRWLLKWQQQRFLQNQLRNSLHPRLLEQFIRSLFQSHHYIASHGVKQQALSSLPICLVIGESGVGKTHVLDNSGLHFYSSEAINSRYQPMASRTMPQFRHTAHKLFVELPTYLFINESNKHLPYFEQVLAFFEHFGYLHHTREILYTISLEKLLSQDELVIKQRDEFFANLSLLLSKIPQTVHVHIALTMADRLLGFTEFFDDLSIEERQLACGINLHQNPLTDTFHRQFQHLAQRLTERLFWRCNGESQLKRRLLVANFPQQFIHTEHSLTPLIQRFHELLEVLPSVKIRGMYWLSNLQQGHLIDLLNQQRIAWRDHQTCQNLPLLLQRKPFFVRGFFQHLNVAHISKTPIKPTVQAKSRPTPTTHRLSRLSLGIAGGLLIAALACGATYITYQNHLSKAIWLPLQRDPALAYTLLTANDPKQAILAYLSHTAPNLSDSRQQSFMDSQEAQAQLQQLADQHVQQAWQTEVLAYYQQHLAGRYPIDRQAKTDVDLKSFTDFYGPQGVLDRFQNEYLHPRSHAQPPPAFFERVQRLQHLLFNASKGMSVTFSLSLDQLGPDIRQVDLTIAGIPLTLKAKAIVNGVFYWPNNANIQQSSYLIQKTHGALQSFNHTGPWSWLAIMQQFHGEHVSRDATGHYEGDWVLNNAEVRLHISSQKDINALINLFNALTPPESL